ncbi:hypothetical protein [Chryseobacterium oryctis]|uniref:Uncharacterized protein n=1 Tax=Chryseobacterium oryctis TaxID=2952618 RepID=A0ABT3HS28_9FLAO|nr:hypothetical protein [Chryseobacterium oryctis]MCW3162592.1 hypothetical protein [Chryseobacterium oryctis]
MKKSVLTLLLLSLGATATFAQVGVNTQNPQAVFHVDGAKDNVTTGIPTAAQQSNDVVITSQGRLGVGTNTPTNNLEVNSEIAGTSGIKITQLPKANTLSTDANGNIIAQDIKTAGVNVTKQRLVIANSSNVINSGSGDYSFRYSSNAAGGYWQMRINNGTSRQFNTWDVEFYGKIMLMDKYGREETCKQSIRIPGQM